MEVPEILKALERYTGEFPREAIREAVAHREEITPELLRIVAEARHDLDKVAAEEHCTGLIFALYLLAEFREERACPLIADLVAIPGKVVMDALGDVVTQDLGRILASVCRGDTRQIERLIEDSNANEYVRGAALKAMVTLVISGVRERDEVVEYFRTLFHGRLEREFSHAWNKLIATSSDLWPGELMEEIRQAYQDDLVELFYIDLGSVEEHLAMGKEGALEVSRQSRGYDLIDDTEADLEWWACFNPRPPRVSATQPKGKMRPRPAVVPLPTRAAASAGTTVRAGRKIGRNEPCPCGSGKKYKKCCGA